MITNILTINTHRSFLCLQLSRNESTAKIKGYNANGLLIGLRSSRWVKCYRICNGQPVTCLQQSTRKERVYRFLEPTLTLVSYQQLTL